MNGSLLSLACMSIGIKYGDTDMDDLDLLMAENAWHPKKSSLSSMKLIISNRLDRIFSGISNV